MTVIYEHWHCTECGDRIDENNMIVEEEVKRGKFEAWMDECCNPCARELETQIFREPMPPEDIRMEKAEYERDALRDVHDRS